MNIDTGGDAGKGMLDNFIHRIISCHDLLVLYNPILFIYLSSSLANTSVSIASKMSVGGPGGIQK
jgi:hypothetical protein